MKAMAVQICRPGALAEVEMMCDEFLTLIIETDFAHSLSSCSDSSTLSKIRRRPMDLWPSHAMTPIVIRSPASYALACVCVITQRRAKFGRR